MALALGLAATACGSSSKSGSAPTTAGGSPAGTGASATGDATGVTSGSIDIGEIADVSGPVPGLFQGAQYGIQAWAAYANANGGIDGRQIKLTLEDSALSCNTYTNAIAALQSSTFASLGTYAIFDSCGKSVLTAHPTYPDIQGAVLTASLNELPNVYTATPSPPGFATTGYQYVKDKFPADITHTAALYGAAVLGDYQEQSNAARSIGFDYVYSRGLGNTETLFTSDILRMKSEGVKIVDMQDCDAVEVADFLQQAQQQGFKPDALISSAGYDPNFFKELGAADGSALVAPLPVAPYLDASSSIANVVALNKYLGIVHPGARPNLFTVEAFTSGLLFQQAMKSAGRTPSRTALLSALSKITSFDGNGIIGPTDPGGKVPGRCVVIIGVRNAAYYRATPSSGYECNGTFVPYNTGG